MKKPPQIIEPAPKTNPIIEFFRFNFARAQKQKPFTLFVLFVVILTFAAMGVGDYVRGAVTNDVVATVGKQQLPISMLEAEIEKFVDAQRQKPDEFSEEQLRSEPVVRQRLSEMIQAQLISQYIRDHNLIPSNEKLASIITSQPEFQQGGVFSKELYAEQVKQARVSMEEFEERIRMNIARDSLFPLFIQTAFVPSGAISNWQEIIGETREVLPHNIVGEKFINNITISDDEKQKYYQENLKTMVDPKKVLVKFIEFSPVSLANTVEINDEELRGFFEINKKTLFSVASEQRDARHILIGFGNNPTAESKKIALTKAEEVIKEVRANPDKFAELAGKYSDDPGSKSEGGLYKNIQRGMMVEEFDKALFELKPNEISDLVETKFGYHIIKLESSSLESEKKFEDVREQVVELYKSEEAKKKYIALAENFKLAVDEKSDNPSAIDKIAEDFGLKTVTSPWVDINYKTYPFDNPELQSSVLATENQKKIVLISPKKVEKLWAFTIVETQEQKQLPFASVEKRVVEELIAKKTAALVSEDADKKFKELTAGKDDLVWEKPLEVNRLNPVLPEKIVGQIFSVDTKKLPNYVRVVNSPTNIVIYKINKVYTDTKFSDEVVNKSKDIYNQYWQSRWINGMLSSLIEKYPVKINEDVLAKLIKK